MSCKDTLEQVAFDLDRASGFSYRCNACKRCCHDKTIHLSPYEILRLARYLGLTTTDVIARHTEAGGTVLRTRDDDGACVFLNERGCGVHPDRPLACRLYPLARSVDPDGKESFGHLVPHPETEGVYGTNGTVWAYLEGQGVAPFFAMGDRYGDLYEGMLDALERLAPEEYEHRGARRSALDETEAGATASSWLDIDKTVAAFCSERGRPVPTTIEETVAVHIEAIEAWLAQIVIARD